MSTWNRHIPILPLGLGLSLFLSISYVLCVLFGIFLAEGSLHHQLLELLPGFTWLTWAGFIAGLAWTIAAAWYAAFVFAPLYNYFASRLE